jgi:hypothetical protein
MPKNRSSRESHSLSTSAWKASRTHRFNVACARCQGAALRAIHTWKAAFGLVTLISLRGFPCRVVFDERIALEQSMRVRTPHKPSSANHADVDDLGFGKASWSLLGRAATKPLVRPFGIRVGPIPIQKEL